MKEEKSDLTEHVSDLEIMRVKHQEQMMDSGKYMEELETRVYGSN